MKVAVLTFFAVLALNSVLAKSYKGYKVLKTEPLTEDQSKTLLEIQKKGQFQFWSDPRTGSSSEILASPEKLKFLENILNGHGIQFKTNIEDVQTLIDSSDQIQSRSRQGPILDWENYFEHDALNAYVDLLADQYSFVKSVNIGQSYEGRDMKVIQITKAGPGKTNIWIEAGIHAREWISPAMATYIMRELVEKNATQYLDNLNFHIIPSANPDGYEFTRSDDRLWRKTRSKTGSILGCKGVDGNRNWDIEFGGQGSSDNKCSDIYHGPEAFSEIEMRNIRDYVQQLEPVPVLSICLHSHAQYWLYPYGYARGTYPENVDEIKSLGDQAVRALGEVHGTEFESRNSGDWYPAAGASDDWYQSALGSRFTYTIELRDQGQYGFILPANQIIPSGEELWAGLKVVFDKMVELN